jgi:chromosome partitioning protein
MTVYSLSNLKGGSGKTYSAITMASELARHGVRVLVIDLDPQATLSRWVDDPAEDARKLLAGEFSWEANHVEPMEGLFVVRSNRGLAAAEDRRASKLAGRLETLYKHLRGEVDYALVDPPPSVGPLVIAALMASDGILTPVEASQGALDGFTDTRSLARRQGYTLRGVFATNVDVRENFATLPEELRDEFGSIHDGGIAFESRIRSTVQMKRSQSNHELPGDRNPSMTAVQDYRALCAELLRADGADLPDGLREHLPDGATDRSPSPSAA